MKIPKKHLFLSICLPVQIILVQLAARYPNLIERFYSNGIYPIIAIILRSLFGWIPFSFGDILLAFLLIIGIRFIFRLFQSKLESILAKLASFTAMASILYACFYLFWGLNYYREPLIESLQYPTQKYTTDQLKNLSIKIIKKLNYTHFKITKNDSSLVINKYSEKKMYQIALSGYHTLEKKFPQFRYQIPSIKSSLMSLLQSYIGTGGYFNPLTGEAQVNNRIPKTGYPTTICHEIAHQIGFAAEDEANFIGFLAANHNQDIFFKYASYRMAFTYCISELRKRDAALASKLWKSVHIGITQDFKSSYNFWKTYKNPFEPLVKKGYNSYLKANNQKFGIDSYNQVVALLILYYQRETSLSLP
jgi:effector-binding domain-containing protein